MGILKSIPRRGRRRKEIGERRETKVSLLTRRRGGAEGREERLSKNSVLSVAL
jgi:hypothetical protein